MDQCIGTRFHLELEDISHIVPFGLQKPYEILIDLACELAPILPSNISSNVIMSPTDFERNDLNIVAPPYSHGSDCLQHQLQNLDSARVHQ